MIFLSIFIVLSKLFSIIKEFGSNSRSSPYFFLNEIINKFNFSAESPNNFRLPFLLLISNNILLISFNFELISFSLFLYSKDSFRILLFEGFSPNLKSGL